MRRLIDPNEYVITKRPPFGLRWLWRLIERAGA